VNGTVPTAGVDSAAIDADGGRVAWSSTGAIAGAPADRKLHVFVRDLRTHETTLVSRADGPEGASADGDSTGPSLDAAGDVVAFQSRAPNLGLPAGSQQVFVRELTTGRTEPISFPGPGDVPGVRASRPSIDAAGDRVSFIAGATTDNAAQAVYFRDRSSQTTEQASRADGADGPASAAPGVLNASIAASGDCVAFDGNFTDLNDGFASADFASVHMRVLRGECPAPAPGDGTGGGGGGPGGEPPAQPVALSALSVRPSRFWTGGRRSGTTIRFKLSHAARVTLRFDRLSTGHRRGRRCVSDRKARGKRCTIVKGVGSMAVNGKAGSNRQRFSGKLKGKRLALGRYRITATVAGGSGKPRAARAVVVRAPKARVKRR